MNLLLWPFAYFAGAWAWRVRGEEKYAQMELGLRRVLFWGVACGLIVLALAPWWFAVLAIPLGWAGAAPDYFGGQWDFKVKANWNAKNFAVLTIRGMVSALPIYAASLLGVWLGLLQHTVGLGGVLCGAFFVPCYLAGLWLEKYPRWVLRVFTAWGEFLYGGFVLSGFLVA